MKRNVEIIAYHGWGMNARFWDQWDDLFDDHVHFKKNDRGYFSEPVNHHFTEKDSFRVLFVQGFGMHWVSNFDWKNAHLIVLFSTFNNLKEIMSKKRSVEHVVTHLQQEIEHRPNYTLDLFWKSLFKGGDSIALIQDFTIRHQELLIEDLNAYYQNLVNSIAIKDRTKVMLYESEFDELSAFPQAEAMKKLFGKLNYHKRLNVVGHAYPFNRSKLCYDDLSSHVHIF